MKSSDNMWKEFKYMDWKINRLDKDYYVSDGGKLRKAGPIVNGYLMTMNRCESKVGVW